VATIGPITIPDPVDAGAWPLLPDHGSSRIIVPNVETHTFGASNAKRTQRFQIGPMLRSFLFRRAALKKSEHEALVAFYDACKGPYARFDYTHRASDGNTTYKVRVADNSPLSIELLKGWRSQPQEIRFVEVQTATPSYSVTSTLDRFPSGTLNTALLGQVQEIIPLVRIRVKDAGVSNIYLSDRLCVVGGNRYEPRILQWSGISQSTGENPDRGSFTLGNADDVFTDLVDQVDLYRAEVLFSLYHVGTQIKVDLWTGFLDAEDAWSLDDRAATMELRATDGISTSTEAYPPRSIGPTCWKELGGPFCPVSTAGTNAGTPCDKGHGTAAGCVFHGMEDYFGGILVPQQLVKLPAGRRSTLMASSVLNEASNGQALKEVYTDIPLQVPCEIVAGRDESEYRAGLGIIGAGPIASINPDLTQQKLNGVGPHGGNTGLGFRFIPGEDPITDTTKHRMGLDEASAGWNAPAGTPYAAGVAAIQVRTVDAKGVQGFKIAEWQMEASVTGGLGGWRWTAAGTRVWVASITNPVWIGVNAWLKQNGVWCHTSHAAAVTVGTMEEYFDVDACMAAAAVADTSVPVLVGSGSETQFKFIGVIGEQRPFRQWLADILAGSLCDFTFRNKRLRIYARINSSAATAFTTGNTLFRSMAPKARAPRFNHLTVEFGDAENNFQRSGVALYDEQHAKRRGSASGQPAYLKQTANFPGVVTKSQASRLCITLMREELGGYTAAEQRKARDISWSTTVLALECEPGMVASFTGFRKVPDGTEVRISRWVLNPDFSIDLFGSTTTDGMYDFTVGPKPADVSAGPVDLERAPAIKYRRWFPNFYAPDANDPTFDEYDLSFAAGISYEDLKDGSKRALLSIQGRPHVNALLPVDPPQIRTIAFTSTGGSLEGTHPLYVCVAPYDSTGRRGPRSRTLAIHLDAATSTCQVVLSNITWPAGTWTGYLVYAGREERAMCLYQSATGTPSSITINGPERRATEGPPEAGDLGYRIRVKELLVPGAIKAVVSSLPTTTKIVCDALAGTSEDYTGETLMVVGDASDGFAPLRSWTVSAFDDVTGEFTVDRTHAGTDPLQTGDTILVLCRATTASSTTIGNSFLSMPTNGYEGAVVRIFAGFGAGQFRRIGSNDGTTLTIDTPWDANPTSGSLFVVEAAGWQYEAPMSAVGVTAADQVITGRVPLENFQGRTVLAMGFLVDAEGNIGAEDNAPFRIVEVVGSEGVAPGNDPPGPIQDFTCVSVDNVTDPGYSLIAFTWNPPTTPNNFDHVNLWISADGVEPFLATALSHPVGSAGAGGGTLKLARPTGATDWDNVIAWGPSASATYTNSLVVASGAGQTPNVAVGDITAWTDPSAVPDAPNVDSVIATVEYLDIDGVTIGTSVNKPIRWRIASATIGYGASRPNHIAVDIVWFTDGSYTVVAQTNNLRDWIDVPGSGDTILDPTDWWELPYYGEKAKIQVRAGNSAGKWTDPPYLSSDLGVVAGTFYPTSPNVTSINGTIEYLLTDGTISSSSTGKISKWRIAAYTIVFPATRSSIGYFEVYVQTATSGAFSTIMQTDQLQEFGAVPGSGDFTGDQQEWWELPAFGEHFRLLCRAFTKDAVPNPTPIFSSDLNVAAAPTAPNVATVTASAFPNGEFGWGVNWSLTFAAGDRNLIRRLRLFCVKDPGTVTAWDQFMAGPIVPASGGLTDSTDGAWNRPDATETYRVDAEIEDVYGRFLPRIPSDDFTISPWAWQQVTWGGSVVLDYTAVQGALKVTANIIAPNDPELVAARLYQVRGSGKPQEIGVQPITHNTTTAVDFIVDLPAGAPQSIDVHAVPVHDNGSADVLRTSGGSAHPKITIAADPSQQAVQYFKGVIEVPTLPATVSYAVTSVGDRVIMEVFNPGGQSLTLSSDFEPVPFAVWPTGRSRLSFTVFNRPGGKKWVLDGPPLLNV